MSGDRISFGIMNRAAFQPPVQVTDRRRRLRFSSEEYWFLVEQGMVPKLSEFVDGEIYEMPAQYYPAVAAIGRFDRALKALWHDPDLVAVNVTHVFPGGWEPMPDVVVYDALPPRRPGKGVVWPAPRLVVEVADETLEYDLGEKASRYAAEGVEELWVGDVKGRELHVLREPDGGDWRLRRLFKVDDEVSPLCLPDAKLSVGELLPDLYGSGGASPA